MDSWWGPGSALAFDNAALRSSDLCAPGFPSGLLNVGDSLNEILSKAHNAKLFSKSAIWRLPDLKLGRFQPVLFLSLPSLKAGRLQPVLFPKNANGANPS